MKTEINEGILPFREAKREFERKYLTRVLWISEGNVTRAARIAQKDRKDFYQTMRRNKINPSDFKGWKFWFKGGVHTIYPGVSLGVAMGNFMKHGRRSWRKVIGITPCDRRSTRLGKIQAAMSFKMFFAIQGGSEHDYQSQDGAEERVCAPGAKAALLSRT